MFEKLAAAKFGTVLVIVDQPASIGALPLAVAPDAGCKVTYLPGLAMRRIADLWPGRARTDHGDGQEADAAADSKAPADTTHTTPDTDEETPELDSADGADDGERDEHAGSSPSRCCGSPSPITPETSPCSCASASCTPTPKSG